MEQADIERPCSQYQLEAENYIQLFSKMPHFYVVIQGKNILLQWNAEEKVIAVKIIMIANVEFVKSMKSC